jgi:hypothetical protein
MNYTQKSALYGLYLTGFLLLIPLVDLVDTKIPFYVLQIIGLIGTVFLILPIYRLNKSKDKTFDELDKKICIRAGIIAVALLCAAAIAAYTLILFAFESFSLNKDHLAVIIYFGSIIFISAMSMTILFQYHCLNKIGKGGNMNRMQKISWFMVICIGTALILSAIAITALYFKFGFPVAWAGWGFMGITGFAGLAPTIFKKDPGPVQCDERDRLINIKAAQAGFAISYGVFGLLCMGIWAYRYSQSTETISIHLLPMLFMAAGITAYLTHAITILVLYGKDNKATEGGPA